MRIRKAMNPLCGSMDVAWHTCLAASHALGTPSAADTLHGFYSTVHPVKMAMPCISLL